MNRSTGEVWVKLEGTDAVEVVPSIAGPFVFGQEKSLVYCTKDFRLDGRRRAISVLERSQHLDLHERRNVGAHGRSAAVLCRAHSAGAWSGVGLHGTCCWR